MKQRRQKPPIEVRSSHVHGRGVFATKRIRKNTRIIQYTGKRVTWESVPDDSDDPHTFLFGLDDGALVIDPTIGGNDARWINHSCDPNCEAIEEDGRVFIYALRDIRPGEELSYDYRLEVDEPVTREKEAESRCSCGSSNCRGTMLEQGVGRNRDTKLGESFG
jgi:SET domain-containing protein